MQQSNALYCNNNFFVSIYKNSRIETYNFEKQISFSLLLKEIVARKINKKLKHYAPSVKMLNSIVIIICLVLFAYQKNDKKCVIQNESCLEIKVTVFLFNI